MRWFLFWLVVLFVGLLPLPPAVELIIVVGFVSHTAWFVRNRLRRAAERLALLQAEEQEYRRRHRRRPLPPGASGRPARKEFLDPIYHDDLVA
jgi:hypothetical protein